MSHKTCGTHRCQCECHMSHDGHHHGETAVSACHEHDHEYEHKHEHDHDMSISCDCDHDHPQPCSCENEELSQPMPVMANRSKGLALLYIKDMDCPVEVNDIRGILSRIDGICHLDFQLASRTLSIDADRDALEKSIAAIKKAGYSLQRIDTETEVSTKKEPVWRLWLALAIACIVELLHFFADDITAIRIGGMALSVLAIWLSGFTIYRKGWLALREGRFNINALTAVAVTGAFLIGQWPEAAMVMALYAIAEMIEARSSERAHRAIHELFDLTPATADIRSDNGDWTNIPVKDIVPGAIARVRPGERIPVDGIIIDGTSAVNQSPVTGESIPVDKIPGNTVFAGTINETGTLEIRVSTYPDNTVVARILKAVEEAQENSAPIERFIDRFAAIYTPAVFLLALCIAIITPFLLGWTWLDAIYKALVMLVIACPCALVIATPVTIISGLAAAARLGILVKGGIFLEEARHIKALALDKTGTVTEGKPRLLDTKTVSTNLDENRILDYAASLAEKSAHPVSKAIAAGLNRRILTVADFTDLPGKGILGAIAGYELMMGNRRLIEEKGIDTQKILPVLEKYQKRGHTVTILASKTEALAVFAVADTIKETACEALAQLKKMGIVAVMLTGDNETTAKAIAHQAGIENIRSNLLPSEKQQAISSLQKQYGKTAMTGDGINDAPALAHADIGIAMGDAGTDIAMEAADIVIMNDDLRRIPQIITLSARTCAILWQNIVIALAIKFLFLGLALAGSATMWMAVFADMGTSLLVLMNGLRILGKRS